MLPGKFGFDTMVNRFRLDLYIYKSLYQKVHVRCVFFHAREAQFWPCDWCTVVSHMNSQLFFCKSACFDSLTVLSPLYVWYKVWLNMVKHAWQITWRRAPCHVYVSPEFEGRRSEINNLDLIRVPAWHANSDELHFSDILARTTLFLATYNWRNLMSRLVLFLDGTFCGRDKI